MESFSEVKLQIVPCDDGVDNDDENEVFDIATPPPTPPKSPMVIKMEVEMKKKKSPVKPHAPIQKFVAPPKPVEK